ncbi:MAG: hypothetical protein GY803_32660 [Chloroflexi bacterium]|nr:hypothetical protein [Chloroflexota bacterium]
MTQHLYLSLVPEALIASMLSPEEFGSYYAVGTTKKQHGQAMFIELDPAFRHEYFQIEKALKRCVPHKNGSPKRSVYVATYRVLEHVPMDVFLKLYLVTAYGEVLALERSEDIPKSDADLHMYQEIAPVHPLVVSTRGPKRFYKFLTQDPAKSIHLPAICFVELQLGELGSDPEHGGRQDLPYQSLHHLRECLMDLKRKTVHTKLVNRVQSVEFPYRMIKSGVYVGNTKQLAYFPMPSRDELRGKYYRWWRSANV